MSGSLSSYYSLFLCLSWGSCVPIWNNNGRRHSTARTNCPFRERWKHAPCRISSIFFTHKQKFPFNTTETTLPFSSINQPFLGANQPFGVSNHQQGLAADNTAFDNGASKENRFTVGVAAVASLTTLLATLEFTLRFVMRYVLVVHLFAGGLEYVAYVSI